MSAPPYQQLNNEKPPQYSAPRPGDNYYNWQEHGQGPQQVGPQQGYPQAQPQGYTQGYPQGYPQGYQSSAPVGYQGQPNQIPSYINQQPQATSTTTLVSHQQVQHVLVVGGCPACRVGVLEDDFTCLGVLCAILFFPLGILCCLAMRQRRCPNCGAIFG